MIRSFTTTIMTLCVAVAFALFVPQGAFAAQVDQASVHKNLAGKSASMTGGRFVAVLKGTASKPVIQFSIRPSANINRTGKTHTVAVYAKFDPSTGCFKAVLPSSGFKGKMRYFNGARVNACFQPSRKEGPKYIAAKARQDPHWRLAKVG